MCGIAGWVDFQRDLRNERGVGQAMTETMACRGPDDQGLWLDSHAVLGHRRMSVIDQEGGHQPMAADEDGRTLAVITYCSEIYNFRELREELRAYDHTFRTRCDTEVVLRAYLQWGDGFAARLNGIF
jgi:asparagine synthase (glutamine-hydrolysing)